MKIGLKGIPMTNNSPLKLRLIYLVFTVSLSVDVALAQTGTALDDFQNVSLEELANPPAEDWLMWRRTANHWGYSPLNQINKNNVASLRLAWAWTMEPGLQETTPLVRNGVMFLPQACDFIEAVDARGID